MNAFLLYLIQVIFASGILYGYYHLVLRNKEFHQYNRFYLLSAAIVSLLLPLLKIPVYFEDAGAASVQMLRGLQTIYWGGEGDSVIVTAGASGNNSLLASVLYLLYWTVGALLLLRLLISLAKIIVLLRRHPVEKLQGVDFVNTEEPGTPFTFFRWLFWDRRIDLETDGGQQIFRHEVYHIQQKHSWDVIVMEMIRTVIWINPFFHLIRKELRAIHEFLADQFAASEQEKWSYAEFLLMQALQTRHKLVNPFFHSQIKRRIAMITKSQKTSHRYLRKVLALPIGALVLGLVAFKVKEAVHEEAITGPFMKVVIDPGHGGFDPGTTIPGTAISESAISLQIAKRVQELAAGYNIEVVLTRDANIAVGNTGNKSDDNKFRIRISQESGADAFVSLHVNSAGGNAGEKRSGIEAFISGTKQNPVDQILASTLLNSLAEIYPTAEQIKIRQGSTGVYVLDANPLPAVLLEVGYLTNPKDRAFISNKSDQTRIAHRILKGLRLYRNNLPAESTSLMIGQPVVADTTPVQLKLRGINNESTVVNADGNLIRVAADREPLFVIDGVVLPETEKVRLDTLDPNRIDRVEVLKGDRAVTRFGPRAVNGVVSIHTKTTASPEIREITVEGYASKTDTNRVPFVAGTMREERVTLPIQKVEVVEGYIKELKADTEKAEVVEGHIKQLKGDIKTLEISAGELKPKTGVGIKEVPGRIVPGDEMNEVVVVGYSRNEARQEPFFEKVEILPQPEGGDAAWRKHLERNLDADIAVKNNAPIGNYTVKIKFLVDREGNISNIIPLTMHGYGMEDEAIRAIKNGPRWTPARQNGKPVNAFRTQPIVFVVAKDDSKKALTGSTQQSLKLSYGKQAVSEKDITGTIYPNPSSHQTTLQIKAEKSDVVFIRIFDMNGNATNIQKKVTLQPGTNTITLDTQSLTNGNYLVQVTGEQSNREVYKLVKQ